jgi:hypothetical protein
MDQWSTMAINPELVLLPGLLCDDELWRDIVDGLSGIATCHVADLTSGETLGDLANAVLSVAPPQFALVGFSFGGSVREPRRNTCARRRLMAVDWNTSGSALEPGWGDVLGRAARAAGPPLLFDLRLWASVCLALYVAFSLELDNASWAGTSAALVCQPHLGASLRKGWFRMIGTLAGAVAIVQLTAMFPQNRAGIGSLQ